MSTEQVNTLPNITVLNIIDRAEGKARVILNRETFDSIKGQSPAYKNFTTETDSKGRLMRVFQFANGKLFSRLDRTPESTTSIFVMNEAEAEAAMLTANPENVIPW